MTSSELKTAQNELQLRNRRREVSKEIVGSGVKFCVGAFFGAIAAFITKNSEAPKFERYAAVAGGFLVGSVVGNQASDMICASLDKISDNFVQAQSTGEEEKQGG